MKNRTICLRSSVKSISSQLPPSVLKPSFCIPHHSPQQRTLSFFNSPPQGENSRFFRKVKEQAAVLPFLGAEGSQRIPGSPDKGRELTARAAAASPPCTGCTAASPCASAPGRALPRTAAEAAGREWPARGLPRSRRCLAGKAAVSQPAPSVRGGLGAGAGEGQHAPGLIFLTTGRLLRSLICLMSSRSCGFPLCGGQK